MGCFYVILNLGIIELSSGNGQMIGIYLLRTEFDIKKDFSQARLHMFGPQQ